MRPLIHSPHPRGGGVDPLCVSLPPSRPCALRARTRTRGVLPGEPSILSDVTGRILSGRGDFRGSNGERELEQSTVALSRAIRSALLIS